MRKLGKGARAVAGRLVRAPRKGSVVVIEFPDGMHEYVTTPVKREMCIRDSHQWVFDLRWDRGDVWLVDVRPLDLPAPQATPRVMGRFALELFEGAALFERVRFDFPLLGAVDTGDGGWSSAPSITQKLRTRIGVVFPATHRGTRLELVDRATNRRWSVPWPPDEATDAATSSQPRDVNAAP